MNEAARLSQCVLSLPIHTEMTKEEQEYIIDAILDFYSNLVESNNIDERK